MLFGFFRDSVNVSLSYAMIAIGSFALTFFALKFFMRVLPKDQGRQYAVNGALSEGKPRGAGIIFITSFVLSCALFVPLDLEQVLNLALIYGAMLTGFFDDAAQKPWGELKKGLLDVVIAAGISLNFVWHNSTEIAFFNLSWNVPKPVYFILGMILVWASINVTNCSDGVDGLCGSLSAVTIFLFTMISFGFEWFNLAMIMTLLAYLWFNASPSKLLMGDAGSRAIGVFIAVSAMQSERPLMFIPLAIVLILDGGLGLVKLTVRRVLKNKTFMESIRTPLHDHARKNKGWSDTQVVIRFVIIQLVVGYAAIRLTELFDTLYR
ncbi:MAG: phospho-N-acetylmuramoyl-pentapeptide-transferase [Oscillospiraceae bacterium]